MKVQYQTYSVPSVDMLIQESWKSISPFWVLDNLIAVNPLQGFEALPFERAIYEAENYFCREDLPKPMAEVNRQSIKWFQAFFDTGQATIPMPGRERGLLKCWLSLCIWDKALHTNSDNNLSWLKSLPAQPDLCIEQALEKMEIPIDQWQNFLTLMLTTLPGWAGHVKYLTEWTCKDSQSCTSVSQAEYLAVRVILTAILWSDAKDLLMWWSSHPREPKGLPMVDAENTYKRQLLTALDGSSQQTSTPKAQFIFCIDVRSEPMRRAIEAQGQYETFGFAGFFGILMAIERAGQSYASCPVLLQPEYTIESHYHAGVSDKLKSLGTKLYQSLKYTFTSPFALVESMGLFSGAAMLMRNIYPMSFATGGHTKCSALDIDAIPFDSQVDIAENSLRMMGLVQGFAPFVIVCGHGSTTQNNAFASALDCGACAGRHGDFNARVFSQILNNPRVRMVLSGRGIVIPAKTVFVPAKHDTTTDHMDFYEEISGDGFTEIEADLQSATHSALNARLQSLGDTSSDRSIDWSQVRPEWGLAGNASFIVGPRSNTKTANLAGRSFMHSYDWRLDPEGSYLLTILTAPMVVAQWINCQYLFSTYDNVAYGAGSKVTKNITGKMGVMQGNASDLMTGLPLQSVNKTDDEAFHQPLRLLTVVYAPYTLLDKVIGGSEVLKKLFGNGWVNLVCIDPNRGKLTLTRSLAWEIIQ